MKTAKKAQELFVDLSAKNRELINLWAQTGQTVFDQLSELSRAMASEGIRRAAEFQLAVLEDATEVQAYWLRRQGELGEWIRTVSTSAES